MKVDPVVTNADQLYIANMTQINKIKFLQTQKVKRENYIKDLQQTLGLNKQSMLSLASDKKDQSIKTLNKQNGYLFAKLKKYYEDYMDVNAKLLIEQQLRIEQKKFYSERILDFQNNMTQLRKYLQDKQQSFSSVVTRLKKYEDLNEVTLETKLHKIANDLNQQFIEQLFRKLTEQRDRYKSVCEKINIDMDDLIFLKSCLDNKQSFESLQQVYSKYKQKAGGKEEKGISFYQKTKNSTNYSNNMQANLSSMINKNQRSQINSSNSKNPNKQLIKLLKKEKLSNEILQQALNEAIQKNQQLYLENQKLVQANQRLEIQKNRLQCKCYLLEQQLTSYDKSLAWKQNWKSKCDLDRQQRIKLFQRKGQQQQQCIRKMNEDMQKLSSFIVTCVPKGKMVKSSSNPNFTRNNQNVVDEEEDIQIEQI